MADAEYCWNGFYHAPTLDKPTRVLQAKCSREHCQLWWADYGMCSTSVVNAHRSNEATLAIEVAQLQKVVLSLQLRALGEDPDKILQVDEDDDEDVGGSDEDDTPEDLAPSGGEVLQSKVVEEVVGV